MLGFRRRQDHADRVHVRPEIMIEEQVADLLFCLGRHRDKKSAACLRIAEQGALLLRELADVVPVALSVAA